MKIIYQQDRKGWGDDSHPDVVKFVAKGAKGGEKEVSFVAKAKSVSD